MASLLRFFSILLPILYFITTFYYGRLFFHDDKHAEKQSSKFLSLTLVLHFLYIFLRGWTQDHYPMASVFEVASAIAFSLGLIYRYIESRLKVKTTGYFILVLIFLIQLFSSLFIEKIEQVPEILKSPIFDVHSTFAALGYTALILSAIYSFMYILLYHDIKSSRFSIIFEKLPSLETLGGMIYKASVLGIVFLSVAILFGHIFLKVTYDRLFSFDFKILSVYFIWIIYFLVIIGKKKLNWPPRLMAYLSILGVALIALSMVFINLFAPTFHKFL